MKAGNIAILDLAGGGAIFVGIGMALGGLVTLSTPMMCVAALLGLAGATARGTSVLVEKKAQQGKPSSSPAQELPAIPAEHLGYHPVAAGAGERSLWE